MCFCLCVCVCDVLCVVPERARWIEILNLLTFHSFIMCFQNAQVWDAVAQRVPERARWIEILGQALAEAEERRRVAVEGQLVVMVSFVRVCVRVIVCVYYHVCFCVSMGKHWLRQRRGGEWLWKGSWLS